MGVGGWVVLLGMVGGLVAARDVGMVKVTDGNYEQIFDGSLWVLSFCKPASFDCKLLDFALDALGAFLDESQITATRALITPVAGLGVFRAFEVHSVPTVLVVNSGYVYNYTGPLEADALIALIGESGYLKCDRRKLAKKGLGETRNTVAEMYQEHPIYVTSGCILAIAVCGWTLIYLLPSHSKSD